MTLKEGTERVLGWVSNSSQVSAKGERPKLIPGLGK